MIKYWSYSNLISTTPYGNISGFRFDLSSLHWFLHFDFRQPVSATHEMAPWFCRWIELHVIMKENPGIWTNQQALYISTPTFVYLWRSRSSYYLYLTNTSISSWQGLYLGVSFHLHRMKAIFKPVSIYTYGRYVYLLCNLFDTFAAALIFQI